MWLVYMMYPEVNTVQGHRRGATLMAQGLIRVSEMQVGHARSEAEAKRLCLKLAVQTLKDHGHQTTVIGYGIRNYYAKKGAKLSWKMSIPQLVRVLKARKARREAAVKTLRTSHTKKGKAA